MHDVGTSRIKPVFTARCRGLRGLHKVDTSRIRPVSIVDRFAVCSETTFSGEVMGATAPIPLFGAPPQTPQGTSPLDPMLASRLF